MKESNRLILSIAHRPLPNDLLDKLINETASKSKQLLAEMEMTSNHHGTNPISKQTLHVLLTGSPSITVPGRTYDDWETKWTPGEHIFAKFIDRVGLQKFHRLPRKGEPRLNGKLVDVKQNDFEIDLDGGGSLVEEQLRNELLWIAINVKQHFNLYAKAPVSDVVILYPFDHTSVDGDDDDGDGGQGQISMGANEIASTINNIFHKEWSETEGPLGGVQISIQIVSVDPVESKDGWVPSL
jgi:hypothetical protein